MAAVTQADVDALNKAIASGERQVTIGGQSVSYYSKDQLIAARDDLLQQLANQQAVATGQPRKRRTMLYHKGRGY